MIDVHFPCHSNTAVYKNVHITQIQGVRLFLVISVSSSEFKIETAAFQMPLQYLSPNFNVFMAIPDHRFACVVEFKIMQEQRARIILGGILLMGISAMEIASTCKIPVIFFPRRI